MKFLLSCIVSFLLAPGIAQQQYTFTNYTQEQGLPSSIYGMCKDTSGFLWLWGERSLARFDGYNFKNFRHNPDDTTSLPGKAIGNVGLMTNGDLLFLIAGGTRLYDPHTLSFTRQFAYKDAGGPLSPFFSLKQDVNAFYFFTLTHLVRFNHSVCEYFQLVAGPPLAVAGDSSNLLYLDIAGRVYLFKVNERKFDQVPVYDRSGNPDTTVYAINYSATENNFIAISKKHLYRYNYNSNTFKPALDLHQSGEAGQLYQNIFFACRPDGNLYKLNIETGAEKLIYLNKKIPERELTDRKISAALANNGLLWIQSQSMGLFRYDIRTDQYEQFIHEPGNPASIPSNAIHRILPDDDGVIWVLCLGLGLVKIEPVKPVMDHINPPVTNPLALGDDNKNIRAFLEMESGYLVGSLSGLFHYDPAKKEFDELAGLFGTGMNSIGAMAKDNSGNIWIGTWGGQLCIINPANNRHISPVSFLPWPPRVRDLICDHTNTIWIATEGNGIYMVDANNIDFDQPASLQFKHVLRDTNNRSTISSNIIFTLTEDADGNIWAGTDNGVNRYDRTTKQWTHYANIPADKHSLYGNDVRSLAIDKNGSVWIGTNGGGLNRYNAATTDFTHFTTANGLPDDAIYTIRSDNDGMLWLGTNRGLCRFNPDDYSCKNFTLKDGIQNYEFNTGAALKLKDGRMLFGGVDGYNSIDPGKIVKSTPPRVAIVAIKVYDREIPPGDGYSKLTHNENNLTFEFAALSFYNNQDNRYAYKMEGLDPDWIYSNDRRFVTYSNLRPGDYTFRVKGSNSDGVWNETGAQHAFTITPPWWATWWSYSIYVVLFCIAVYSIIYFLKNVWCCGIN